MTSRIVFIQVYGLFLGLILSFLYAGPLFNKMEQSSNLKNLFLLIIFISATISCIRTYKFNLNSSKEKIRLMMLANIFFSLVFYFVGQFQSSVTMIIISSISSFIMGYSAMFISNTLLAVSKKYNNYEEIFINIAAIMLIANAVSYIVYILLSFDLNNSALILALFSGIYAVFLSFKIDFNSETSSYNLFNLDNKDLYILGYFILLLKTSEGMVYKILEFQFALQQNYYEYTYIIPYILALLISFFISHKTNRKIFPMLSACISLVGIGLLLLLISEENAGISNLFIHFGVGFLDIIIWGSIICLIYIYGNGYKIASVIMLFQILGVYIGGLISEINIDQTRIVYIVGIICIFASVIFLPKVNEIIIRDIDSKKKY